jgi:hypothetical protein
MRALVKRPALRISFFVVLVLAISTVPLKAAQEDPERARAFQLYQDAKYAEALPVFEKLAAKYPEDRDVIKTYGYLVLNSSARTMRS